MDMWVVLSVACLVTLGNAKHPTPPLPPQPAMFSGVFDDNMVLQRAPARAAVFGTTSNFTSQPTDAVVSVEVTSMDEITGDFLVSKTYTANVTEDGSWKVLLDAAEAGGDVSITCTCSHGCVNSSVGGKIMNATFGDVYFCSGQSNMELLMKYTFSRNDTLDAIAKGMYQNIRIRQFPKHPSSDPSYTVHGGMGELYPNASTWLGAGQALVLETPLVPCYKCPPVNRSVLMEFSAACWYFGQALTDELSKMNNGQAPPIGLIASSVGGTIIELWTPTDVQLSTCQNITCGAKMNKSLCGTLYNGMVAPFINMTVKGYIWYQGENNVGGFTGNSMEHTGYGCMLPTMISTWRKMWSVVSGTTDPLAPFGIYTLAAGTSEGHGTHMGGFRWSQTANYGVVPNPAMPNCFVASGYDMGDPWGKGCGGRNCCQYDHIIPKPPCSGDKRWSVWTTHFFMGPIHPRPKLPFATRLAKAASVVAYGAEGPATGPVISGCSMSSGTLTIRFNATLLTSGEKVIVQDYNQSLEMMASALEVCTKEVDPPYAPDFHDKNWTHINLKADASGMSIIADLGPLNGTNPTAVRYAWDDYPCCGSLDRTLSPCPMGSCPVMGSPSMLPAMPFFALIEDNKCKCIPPQVCDG